MRELISEEGKGIKWMLEVLNLRELKEKREEGGEGKSIKESERGRENEDGVERGKDKNGVQGVTACERRSPRVITSGIE